MLSYAKRNETESEVKESERDERDKRGEAEESSGRPRLLVLLFGLGWLNTETVRRKWSV